MTGNAESVAGKRYTAKVFNGFIYLFDQDDNVLKNSRGAVRRWPFDGDDSVEECLVWGDQCCEVHAEQFDGTA